MSGRHMEIYYEHNFKSGSVKLMINDLESKNGTWLRLSEK
jgi:pSer/pThr/pTyr-binding forkhead associated (FHA) protein